MALLIKYLERLTVLARQTSVGLQRRHPFF